jgi:hypothetical protein
VAKIPYDAAWEYVSFKGDHEYEETTARLRVPGGWLYREARTAGYRGQKSVSVAIAFVPDATAPKDQEEEEEA